MSGKTVHTMLILAAALALSACQKPAEKATVAPAPAATQPAPEAQPAAPAAAAKPEAPALSTAMTAEPAPAPKPAAPAPEAPKPAATATMSTAPAPAPKPAAMTMKPAAPAPAPKPAVPAPKPAPTQAATTPFSTTKCMACHAIDHDKVGPAWKTVVEKYGDEAALAKDFGSGFKERRVANSIAKWKSKEGLMTSQFNSLIKGHEKEAAHALFMTVKHGKFGSY